MPYPRGETQSELHYPNNTLLFSPFRKIGNKTQRKHRSGANLKRRTLTNRKGSILTATQVRTENHHDDYELSKKLSEPLEDKDPLTAELWQKRTLDDLLNAKKKKIAEKISNIKSVLSTEQRYVLERASEKGASAWLNVLPLKQYRFHLNKCEFRDGLSLRYSWNPKNAPLNCPCREIFSLTHALHCPKGGYTIVRHNEIRDTFANLISEICRDVAVEPLLQPLDGEKFDRNSTGTDDARLDIKANGLWGTVFERAFFDVKIFNPLAKSCPKTIRDSYKYYEELKKLKYEQRIRDVENSTFNPLVFSSTGGAGPSASKVMKRLVQKISDKREEKYSDVMSFIRTKIGIALLKSSVQRMQSPQVDMHHWKRDLLHSGRRSNRLKFNKLLQHPLYIAIIIRFSLSMTTAWSQDLNSIFFHKIVRHQNYQVDMSYSAMLYVISYYVTCSTANVTFALLIFHVAQLSCSNTIFCFN